MNEITVDLGFRFGAMQSWKNGLHYLLGNINSKVEDKPLLVVLVVILVLINHLVHGQIATLIGCFSTDVVFKKLVHQLWIFTLR